MAGPGPSPAAPAGGPHAGLVLVLEIVLAVGYTVLAHLASARDSAPLALAALVVLVVMLLASPLAARRPAALLALPLLVAGCVWLYHAGLAAVPLLLVPVAFIGLIAWMFGRTLAAGRMPLITRIVTTLDQVPPAQLAPGLAGYTRRLTLAWTLLLLVLACVNLVLALLASPGGLLEQVGVQPPWTITREQWSWVANLVNYGVVAAFFVAEFQLRIRRFPGRYPSFVGFLRRLGTLGPTFWRDQLR